MTVRYHTPPKPPSAVGDLLAGMDWNRAYQANPLVMRLADGADFIPPDEWLRALERAFPTVHVEAVLRATYGKCCMGTINPPTKRGAKRALTNWCALEAKRNAGRRY